MSITSDTSLVFIPAIIDLYIIAFSFSFPIDSNSFVPPFDRISFIADLSDIWVTLAVAFAPVRPIAQPNGPPTAPPAQPEPDAIVSDINPIVPNVRLIVFSTHELLPVRGLPYTLLPDWYILPRKGIASKTLSIVSAPWSSQDLLF